MVNSTATAAATPLPPNPDHIKKFLVPISFLKRVWNVVKGIFSKDSLKTRWDVKYKINAEFLQDQRNVRTNRDALVTIAILRDNIEKSDIQTYLGNWTKKEIDCSLIHKVAFI